jgi:hypothetical protein
MFRNLDYAFTADPGPLVPLAQTQPVPPPTVGLLRACWQAFSEGLAAHREYERLRSTGLTHDRALKRALGIGRHPARHAHRSTAALYYAGRA